MRTTLPCPHCQQSLTFISTPRGLACPFCRSDIQFPGGKVPAGKRVRCKNCGGVFTAESPPPSVRVFASQVEPCPTCNRFLAIRMSLPPGKKVCCYKCGTKFLPRQSNAPALPGEAGPHRPESIYHVENEQMPQASQNGAESTDADHPLGPPLPRRPASKTRLGKGSGRSSITHLAIDPLAEIGPPAAPTPAVNDDEVDFFSPNQPCSAPAAQPPAKARANPVESPNARLPQRNGPRNPTPEIVVQRKRKEAIEATASDVTAPTLLEAPPAPAAKRRPKKKAKAAQVPQREEAPSPPPEPAAEAPAAEETPLEPSQAEEPLLGPQPMDGAKESPPLSSRSMMELAAAEALLDEPDVAVVEEPDEQPVALEEPVKPAAKPVEMPSRPYAPARPMPASSSASGLKMPSRQTLTYAGLAAAICLVVFGGYQLFARASRPKLYPTDGIVLFQGKPAVGATVTLIPVGKSGPRISATGKVGEDGTFKLTTYQLNDGAPAGRYKVTISRGQMDMAEYAELGKKFSEEEVDRIRVERSEDPLDAKYGDPRGTELTADIPAPSNRLIYELD